MTYYIYNFLGKHYEVRNICFQIFRSKAIKLAFPKVPKILLKEKKSMKQATVVASFMFVTSFFITLFIYFSRRLLFILKKKISFY